MRIHSQKFISTGRCYWENRITDASEWQAWAMTFYPFYSIKLKPCNLTKWDDDEEHKMYIFEINSTFRWLFLLICDKQDDAKFTRSTRFRPNLDQSWARFVEVLTSRPTNTKSTRSSAWTISARTSLPARKGTTVIGHHAYCFPKYSNEQLEFIMARGIALSFFSCGHATL